MTNDQNREVPFQDDEAHAGTGLIVAWGLLLLGWASAPSTARRASGLSPIFFASTGLQRGEATKVRPATEEELRDGEGEGQKVAFVFRTGAHGGRVEVHPASSPADRAHYAKNDVGVI